MPVLRVSHTAEYRYAQPVRFGEHRLMIRPRDSHDLRLLHTNLTISPVPAQIRWQHDVFGNSITVVSFDTAAADLRVVSDIAVERYTVPTLELDVAPYARDYPFSYSAEERPDLGRTAERHYADPDHLVDGWSRRFLRDDPSTNTLDLLQRMTAAVPNDFSYERRDEAGTQAPRDTLMKGSGSCRDFALLLIEAARSLGLAARFVTGYLYDAATVGQRGGPVGGGATHAWTQIYVPGAGWLEFDPTNGVVGGDNLIRVAVVRDPSQAVPLSGTYFGAPADALGLRVEVLVTAE